MAKYYLIPGNNGKDCPGNGLHKTPNGVLIKCHCDECDYFVCCLEDECKYCKDKNCYRKKILKHLKKKDKNRDFPLLEKLLLAPFYAPYPEAFIDKFLL